MQLYNSSKTLVGTYNPPGTLSASIDTILDPGIYYFLVDGVGNANTPEYGSLGSYSVETSQSPLVTLPLHKFELKGSILNNQHKFTWLIEADEKVVHQALEVSKDGRHFNSVSEPANDERTYQYVPNATQPLQYRMNVKFDNGREYYSNVIALQTNAVISKPKLFTNIIRNSALMINSPAGYSYIIADYNGRILAKGIIAQGASTVKINDISSGIYFIQEPGQKCKWIPIITLQVAKLCKGFSCKDWIEGIRNLIGRYSKKFYSFIISRDFFFFKMY